MFEFIKVGLCDKFFQGDIWLTVLSYFAVCISGYLLGSLNFGIIISTLFYHDDIRTHGSKSAGANNMLRTFGRLPAAMTFLGDGLKAAVSVLIGAIFFGYNTAFAGTYFGGLASIIGHAFPIYYGFKGGKGVASTAAILLCTQPLVGIICIAVFVVVVAISKYISLGSMVSVTIYPIALFIFTGFGAHIVIAFLIAALVVFLHRANIRRLISGTENKLTAKKSAC